MYVFDLTKLQAADILLINTSERFSAIMQRKTGSIYHHAMLYVGNSSYIHSDKVPGVQADNAMRMTFDNLEAAIALRIRNDSDVDLNSVINNARAKVGTAYSVEEAIRTVKEPSEEDFESNRQFCTRLVSQAFAEAGLRVVPDPDYCSPQDLINSEHFYVVKNILKSPNKEELEYAQEENTVLTRQTNIHNEILSKSRSLTGEDIQTLNQLSEYVIAHPELDNKISDVLVDSGYLHMWQLELEKNPHHYDFKAFTEHVESKYWLSASEKLSKVAEANNERYSTNLSFYTCAYNEKQLRYLKLHVTLYSILVHQCAKMRNVAATAQKIARLKSNLHLRR
jgi:hypothetical protein